MHENNGRELVPQRGPPSDRLPGRQYTVNLGRKRDWLDRVGSFLADDGPPKDRSFGGFLRAWKNKPSATALEMFPLVGLIAVGTILAMDTYHWDFERAGLDFLRAKMPFGFTDKSDEFAKNAVCPAYRARPGETAEQTQRRRDCIDAVIYKSDDRYIIARKTHPREPLAFCETPARWTAPSKNDLVK
jgi:hypothetical protein